MKVLISAVQFKADKKLKTFIEEKINKINGLYDDILEANVILRLENAENAENKVVEIIILVKNQSVFAKKQSKTFEEATDLTLEALKKQLIKHKEKQIVRK
jgi:putative sigma-54 modulation protein